MSYNKASTIAIAQYIHQKQCHRLSNTTTLIFVVVMDMRRSVRPNSRRPRIGLQACLCAISKVVQSVSGRFPPSARQSGSVEKIPLASYAPFGYLVGACNSARPDEVLSVSSKRVQRNAARGISPSTEIVFVNTCTLEICQDVDRMINAVAARYSVPVVSMHALTFLERILTNNVASGSRFWEVEGTHPPFYVHKLIADIVASCLQHRRDPDCNSLRPDTVVSRRHYDSVSGCERPLSSFTAGGSTASADAVDVVSDGWRLFEDRPGKPGWISESPNATISFPQRFGPSPRIVISDLKSYNGLSNARIWIDDRQGEPAIVRGRYDGTDARVSQTAVHIIHAGMTTYQPRLGMDGVIGWGLEPHSQHVLHFAVDTINEDLTRPINGAFKFKILSVYSC